MTYCSVPTWDPRSLGCTELSMTHMPWALEQLVDKMGTTLTCKSQSSATTTTQRGLLCSSFSGSPSLSFNLTSGSKSAMSINSHRQIRSASLDDTGEFPAPTYTPFVCCDPSDSRVVSLNVTKLTKCPMLPMTFLAFSEYPSALMGPSSLVHPSLPPVTLAMPWKMALHPAAGYLQIQKYVQGLDITHCSPDDPNYVYLAHRPCRPFHLIDTHY